MSPDPTAGRIGYVLKMYPRFSETFVLTELLALQEQGVDLDVVSLRPPNDGRFHGALADLRAPVTYLRSSGITAEHVWEVLRRAAAAGLPGLATHAQQVLSADVRDAVQAVELALHVRARGITHLHAHFASLAATVSRLAATLAGITWSMTAHAKDIFHEDVDPFDLRAKLADASVTVTVSDFNLAHLRAEFGADAARVRRVYNGLGLDAFCYRDPVGRPVRIAAVGRLVEKKGFGDLVDAVALLRAGGRGVEVDLVGTGPWAETLRAHRDARGLADVIHLHGALPQAEVVRIVADAAVFAAPCVVGSDGNRDGLPTVLLEAMALGTPCVATPVTGIPEVVRHEQTGLLVPERDPAALARSLARYLDDSALAVRTARAARALVEAEFDTRRQAARVAACFPAGPGTAAPGPLASTSTSASADPVPA